ncbi:MAG: Hpt domain-containing protein [Xenococcus sp. (in: cyanobacteria)]
MDTASQQRILGYFIEEAKEHLQTLEQGILNLSTSAQDAEMVNEMFRAAHSVKGGAAMLGYSSIQKTAHRLEDSFKILKENPVNVDPKLESLFLAGCDHLQDLIERLENSPDFSDADAIETLERAESNFAILQNYLETLLSGGSADGSQASVDIAEQVTATLKQMLQLFKQTDSPTNRQKLQQSCQSLGELAPEQANWQNFITIATKAIGNRKYPYKTIAQVVIKDIKQAGDNLDQKKLGAIVPSKNLQQLAATAPATATKTKTTTSPTTATPRKVAQISIPQEPVAAANALKKVFNRAELSQIIKILSS